MSKLILVIFVALIATIYCATPDCAAYCNTIFTACSGANKQYPDNTTCMAVCGKLPLGTDDAATAGNTVGCRQYHAGVAVATPATHCIHAGPSGGDVCGTLCDAYCNITLSSCTGTNSFFGSSALCMAACSGFNKTGTIADVGGNSAFCHLYHAGAAIAAPDAHCQHASPSGVGLCGSRCENYCSISATSCTGKNKLYADPATCLGFCGSLPDGNVNATGGNSIDCRIYHSYAGVALNAVDTHCPHASHTGESVCGDLCEVYCYLAITHCTGANQLFANTAACMTACSANILTKTGPFNSTSGDSIQCRIYHLGAAKAINAATHCPHGNITSGSGVCGGSTTTGATTATTTTGSTTTGGAPTTTANAFTFVLSFFTLIGFLLF